MQKLFRFTDVASFQQYYDLKSFLTRTKVESEFTVNYIRRIKTERGFHTQFKHCVGSEFSADLL